jgi:tetratricopeptide (TPR) repeat protein
LGNWESAVAGLNVCDSIQPSSLVTLFNRGLFHLQAGNSVAAYDDFTTCISIKPGMMTARFNRAVASEKQGNFQSALQDLDSIVKTGRATTRMQLQSSHQTHPFTFSAGILLYRRQLQCCPQRGRVGRPGKTLTPFGMIWVRFVLVARSF